ncbi:terminase large subunit [Lactiplantibacillus plantarum]|uniref:terminase large subunit n=1 Tax=Lactiplantibacillus plantarum TaxID=1590 RepID=UPI0009B5AC5E|nr:terminase TerL endonuclease subunit [Lactiplantibacillus plantarum]
MMIDYVLDYCHKVLNGDIVANEKIKLACQRELNDRERINNDDSFNYYFDVKKANRVIAFMSLFRSPTGEQITLLPFQKWLVGSLFGWVSSDDSSVMRFKQAFISMSRKNGKSFLISMIGLVYLFLEKEPKLSKEIIFSANTFKQANITFNQTRAELLQATKDSPALRNRLKINRQEIQDLETNSTIKPVATGNGTQENLNGLRGDLVCVDEYAVSKTRDSLKVLQSGMTGKNSLLAIISTSGFNIKCPMFEDYEINTKVLKGELSSDRVFIAIYEQDSEDEINDSSLWEKSNPLVASSKVASVLIPKIENDLLIARQTNDINSLLVKNFNLWKQSNQDSFISYDEWHRTIVDKPNIHGQRVVIGIDLSKSNDLTSVSWIIPQDDGTYYCGSHSWVATKYGLLEKMKADNINYQALADAGECSVTDLESGVIDYQNIFDFIKRMVDKNDLTVEAITYDAWSFGYLLSDFEREDWPLVETAQNNRVLSFPTKQFKEYLLNGQITHPNNHLLSIAVDNSVLIYDSTGNCRINKMKNNNKIDPLAALMNAWTYVSKELIGGTDNEADNEFYQSDEFSF